MSHPFVPLDDSVRTAVYVIVNDEHAHGETEVTGILPLGGVSIRDRYSYDLLIAPGGVWIMCFCDFLCR